MRYLLDTTICIGLIRQKSPILVAKLIQHSMSDIGISTITVAELQYGVTKSARPAQNQQALDHFLLPLAILPFDEESAMTYGEIRVHLETMGTPIGAMDLLIAAQALHHKLVLVTNNSREFTRVPGLHIEDWMNG